MRSDGALLLEYNNWPVIAYISMSPLVSTGKSELRVPILLDLRGYVSFVKRERCWWKITQKRDV